MKFNPNLKIAIKIKSKPLFPPLSVGPKPSRRAHLLPLSFPLFSLSQPSRPSCYPISLLSLSLAHSAQAAAHISLSLLSLSCSHWRRGWDRDTLILFLLTSSLRTHAPLGSDDAIISLQDLEAYSAATLSNHRLIPWCRVHACCSRPSSLPCRRLPSSSLLYLSISRARQTLWLLPLHLSQHFPSSPPQVERNSVARAILFDSGRRRLPVDSDRWGEHPPRFPYASWSPGPLFHAYHAPACFSTGRTERRRRP